MSPALSSQLRRMQESIASFERDWSSGQPTSIEEIIDATPEKLRESTLQTLLEIEQRHRAATKHPLMLAELRSRFPQFPVVLRKVTCDPTGEEGRRTAELKHPEPSQITSQGDSLAAEERSEAVAGAVRRREARRSTFGAINRKDIEHLIRDGQYSKALQQLSRLIDENPSQSDKGRAKVVTWANRQIAHVKRVRDKLIAGRDSAVATARQMTAQYDFAMAASILTDYPLELRTSEMDALLRKVESQKKNVERQLADIDLARRRGNHRVA